MSKIQKGRWTEEEDKLLLEKYSTTTDDELMKLFENRTMAAISTRASKVLNIKKDKNIIKLTKWTEEEDAVLKEHYALKSLEELQEMLIWNERTLKSIKSRVSALKLKKDRSALKYKRWTEEEDNFLIENCTNLSIEEMKQHLQDRTLISVKDRLLKLRIYNKNSIWTEEDIKYLTNMYYYFAKGCIQDLADELRKMESDIHKKIEELNLTTIKAEISEHEFKKGLL